ncbi:MAG: hypothetical protein OM95_15970, partial [Bdellovibrio sp. ArHS]|uniref:LPO_1073/Vpar_1526 family protein n=1 Tax=Bdellovibrio sp. ArHS TaxID=1569284 RepID=UPI0005835F9D
GGSVTVIQGITVTEAREIALDVYKANALDLAKSARDLVDERVSKITDKIVTEIHSRKAEALNSFGDPDFQYKLYESSIAFARSGDADLEKLLVDLMVERASENTRSTKQLILNEAVEVVGKVSQQQHCIIVSVFLARHSRFKTGDYKEFLSRLETLWIKYFSSLNKSDLSYKHLEYLGCMTSSIGTMDIFKILKGHYGGFFIKGFKEEDIPEKFRTEAMKVCCQHLFEKNFLQYSCLDEEVLSVEMKNKGVAVEAHQEILGHYRQTLMANSDIQKKLESDLPSSNIIFEKWKETPLKSCTLTSVGRALAISFLHSHGHSGFNFDTWLVE